MIRIIGLSSFVRTKVVLSIMAIALLSIGCDDTTDTLGSSLTNSVDKFDVLTDTFDVKTSSYAVGAVVSRSPYTYVGHIVDPETGTYVTGSYTTQFAILEKMNDVSLFPEKDSISSLDKDRNIVADSCHLKIYLNNSVGDSLNPMRITAYELAKPVEEGRIYYTNFDPEQEGLLRTDANAIRKNKIYTPLDLNLSDSLRQLVINKTNMQSITIPLNDEYVAQDGTVYKNYGTYLMRMFFEHPEYYKNSYQFAHNVCPGFYIKSTDGKGVMSEVYLTELHIYYRYLSEDSIYDALTYLSGTEEVMQTTTFKNDQSKIDVLADSTTCTYLKTPAGIFTEVELPVEDIMNGHMRDSLSSARIVFQSINNQMDDNTFGEPTYLLMLPKDSLQSFFENKDTPDSEKSFLATYNSSYNTYTYNNISSLVTAMYQSKLTGNTSADWNKVLLIPVMVETNGSTSNSITRVAHEMALKSTRLVGGINNSRNAIRISIIYNKFLKD